MEDAERPASLFKYQAFSVQSLVALQGRTLYFSHPSKFNDPFDCQCEYSAAGLEGRALEDLVESVHIECGRDPRAPVFDLIVNPALRQKYSEMAARVCRMKISEAFAGTGICCLGEESDNLLMWGHYADGHRGFCLEFDSSADPFHRAWPVHYSDQYPIVDLKAFAVDSDTDSVIRAAVLSKPTEWKYEREWRVIHKQAETTYCYGAEALKAVYFGAKIDPKHLHLLATVIHGSETKLFHMKQSNTEYKVIAEHCVYTPHPKSGGGGNVEAFERAKELHEQQNPRLPS